MEKLINVIKNASERLTEHQESWRRRRRRRSSMNY